MPSSLRRSTVSSWTASARSIAGSGSARKKRVFVFSAGATTRTSASSAASPPMAARRASAETGSDTRARIRLAMVRLIPQSPARQPNGESELYGRERELQRALRERVRELHSTHHSERRQRRDEEAVAPADVPVAVLAP